MSVIYKMGSIKPLIILILLSIYNQNIQCKDLADEIKPANDLLNKPYPLATRDRDLRGVVEQIKNRALASWKYLKRVAEGTKRDILKWVNSARQYAINMEKSFEVQLQTWRYGLIDIISGIVSDVEQIQECLSDEAGTIEDTLMEMLNNLTECLETEISKFRLIKGKQEKFAVNDTLFIADLDRKLDACKADKKNYVECLNTVGDLVHEDIKEKHNELQNTGIELRGLAVNIRASVVDCVEQAISQIVPFLISELLAIVNCAFRRSGINKSILV